MSCDELYLRVITRKEVSGIPIIALIKVLIVTFEELEKMEKEHRYVEDI